MTIKLPPRGQRSGPIYQAIADSIGAEIEAGRLKPGSRLPTQRVLARQLGVTLTTVTRAYVEAQRRGLLSGEVGRGTFVRPSALDIETPEQGVLDLAVNSLMPLPYMEELADRLASSIPRSAGARVFGYQHHAGARHNRAAGSAWIGWAGLEAPIDRIVVTGGGQHAILLSLMTLTKPGDEVLVEEFTYPGMGDLAAHLHLRLRTVALDAEGIVPESLDEACRSGKPAALYCIPSFQNPTAAFMSQKRRERIAHVALEHRLTIIEDDVFGFLAPDARPLSSLLPEEQFFYITSTSKSLAPGMRIGYLLAPGGDDRAAVRLCSPHDRQRAAGNGRAGDEPHHRRRRRTDRRMEAQGDRSAAGYRATCACRAERTDAAEQPAFMDAVAGAVEHRIVCRARASSGNFVEQRGVVRGGSRNGRAGRAHHHWPAGYSCGARGRAVGNRPDAQPCS